MSTVPLRRALHDRVSALERRADDHDKTVSPMAGQVKEMYDVFDTWKKVNWFFVKVAGWCIGVVGTLAAILTIIEKTIEIAKH